MHDPLSPRVFFAFLLVFAASASLSRAQVILSNSKVAYTYSDPSGRFVPSSPLTSASPESSLSFAPGSYVASSSGVGFQSSAVNGILTVDMDTAPGLWFSGNAISLFLSGSYSLNAPFSSSQAFGSFAASYSLVVDGVDGNPFSSAMPLAANITNIAPASVSLTGPAGLSNGSWNGSLVLDINTIKTHFGIGSANKVTGMRLQLSTTMAAASLDAMASATLFNVNMGNVTVPEPSTYALLGLSALGLGLFAMRRRS